MRARQAAKASQAAIAAAAVTVSAIGQDQGAGAAPSKGARTMSMKAKAGLAATNQPRAAPIVCGIQKIGVRKKRSWSAFETICGTSRNRAPSRPRIIAPEASAATRRSKAGTIVQAEAAGAMPAKMRTSGTIAALWASTMRLRQTRRRTWTESGIGAWRIVSAAATKTLLASFNVAWMKYQRTRPSVT